MSWKSVAILLTVAAVLFALCWWVERPIRLEQERQADHTLLPHFDPASVNTIELNPRGADAIRLERFSIGTNVAWSMTRPIAYPALAAPIASLLDSLAQLSWMDRLTPADLQNQPDAQEKFGFTQAQMEIVLTGPGRASKLLLGQFSPYRDKVFLEVVGDPNIYQVGSDLLTNLPPDKDLWRDRSLLDLAHLDFDSVAVRSPARGIEFDLHCNPTNHHWSMTKPVQARADNWRLNQWLARLQLLTVRQFVTDDPKADLEPFGLQTSPQTPDLDLSFALGSNVMAELQVGLSPTNHPEFAYARRLAPSNVVLVARDELRPWQGSYTNFLDYHFISDSPDKIDTVLVQGDSSFAVRKRSGQWQVEDGVAFPADATLMREWLASFTNLPVRIEATVAADIAQYGLARPQLQYTLEANGAVLARLDFGVKTNNRVFERRPDELSLNSIPVGEFERLPRAAWQLRDRRVWSFNASNVVSLTVRQQGVTRQYLRDPDGGWTFAPDFHGPPVPNWPAIEEGVHRLGDLRAIFWSGVGDPPGTNFGFAQADFHLSLELKASGKTETRDIQFGGRSPYSYPYASVVLDGQRLVFEFPVDLYENIIDPYMTIPIALRYYHNQ